MFDPSAARVLDVIADSYNPLVALFALAIPPFLRLERKASTLLRFYIASGLGIAIVYVLQAADNRHQLWHSFGLDYSTHSAFAASVVVSLCVLRRSWLPAFGTSLALYFALVLAMRYHGLADVLTAAALSSSATWLAHRFLRRGLQTRGRSLPQAPT